MVKLNILDKVGKIIDYTILPPCVN